MIARCRVGALMPAPVPVCRRTTPASGAAQVTPDAQVSDGPPGRRHARRVHSRCARRRVRRPPSSGQEVGQHVGHDLRGLLGDEVPGTRARSSSARPGRGRARPPRRWRSAAPGRAPPTARGRARRARRAGRGGRRCPAGAPATVGGRPRGSSRGTPAAGRGRWYAASYSARRSSSSGVAARQPSRSIAATRRCPASRKDSSGQQRQGQQRHVHGAVQRRALPERGVDHDEPAHEVRAAARPGRAR